MNNNIYVSGEGDQHVLLGTGIPFHEHLRLKLEQSINVKELLLKLRSHTMYNKLLKSKNLISYQR